MEVFRRVLTSSPVDPTDFMGAMRALRAVGWVQDQTRVEEMMRDGRVVQFRPWWTDPVTGDEVRGWRNVVRVEMGRQPPPPSAAASAIMAALKGKPELAAELRTLLNQAFAEREREDALALATWVAGTMGP